MNSNATSGNCQRNCWLAALVVGVLVAWYLMSGGSGVFLTLVMAVVAFVAVGLLLRRLICSDDTAQVSAPAPVAPTPAPTPKPEPAAEVAPEPEAAPEPDIAPEPEAEPEAARAPEVQPAQASAEGALLKPSTVLPGQDELASRKGVWRYGGDAAATPAAKPADPESEPAQAASEQPAGLAQARDGGADNLKLIKGVGPKLERVLNGMGYFHFDQIAGWTAADIEWVDQNLVGFKGRVSRDGWVDQARALAAGEETEFAKRAKRDKIYD